MNLAPRESAGVCACNAETKSVIARRTRRMKDGMIATSLKIANDRA
jgi:hypothetical protein